MKKRFFVIGLFIVFIVVLLILSGCLLSDKGVGNVSVSGFGDGSDNISDNDNFDDDVINSDNQDDGSSVSESVKTGDLEQELESEYLESEDDIFVSQESDMVEGSLSDLQSESEDLFVKKDNCGCSFSWDPVCYEGRTFLNGCMFRCFGHSLDMISVNSQCPKKISPIKIYTDDNMIVHEPDKWNSGYCWRPMWRDEGIRYCKNIIVNGRFNVEPAPLKGNWINNSYLGLDKSGKSDSFTLFLKAGESILNEEYNIAYQPVFEPGRYRFSFWARQDVSANNDWIVKLKLKDWWNEKPKPAGVGSCYEYVTDIRADEVFIESRPNDWKQYNYEFDVPLKDDQWKSNMRVSSDCEYVWDRIPGGYGVEVIAPSIGSAKFDDFVLMQIS